MSTHVLASVSISSEEPRSTRWFLYFFGGSSGFGGGTGVRSAGLMGSVPAPTCSQGESDSKFLHKDVVSKSDGTGMKARNHRNACVSCRGS
jgi:hypothetical protein